MKRFIPLLTGIFLAVASGCEKNNPNNFPLVDVEEFIFLNNPSNSALLAAGGSITHPGGHRGLIVFRRFFNQDSEDFAAYDRACPTHFEESCSVLEIDSDGLFAVCPCENEKYLLFDGSPGDNAERSLQPYRTFFDGNVVTIRD